MEKRNCEGDNLLFQIVAVGASAGGLQAFESFLSGLPQEFGFAVIFMQHLPPDRKSLMPELLRNRRPDLEFHSISEGLPILPGRVYLCPASEIVTIRDGVFQAAAVPEKRSHFPIDELMIALSEDAPESVIAVILSGAGTDGARGVKAVKAAGGTVFVQDPATAEFPGMPSAAIDTRQTDKILAPDRIAREIVNLSNTGLQGPAASFIDEIPFEALYQLIYEKTGQRFDHYKKNVVARRIRRRMNLHGLTAVGSYLDILGTIADEADLLASDLMIGVTSFFRDRHAWSALNGNVIKQLASAPDSFPIRVWTPACATGEEAYSIAMMLHNELDLAGKRREMLIFASDVNERALDHARAGTYPESVTSDVPPEYAKKYMMRSPDGLSVTINAELRQRLVFARHDILADPPFSRMDLIICRNLLIYLEPYAQDKCITLFHYALRSRGSLFLGNAETVGSNSVMFESIGHKKDRIYRKSETASPYKRPLLSSFSARSFESVASRQSAPDLKPTISDIAQKALIQECGLAAVAINQNYDILYYSGPMNRYLRNPEGGPTQNLLDLLPDGMRGRIRGALYRVGQSEKPVSMRSVLAVDGAKGKELTLRMSKLKENLFLISFREREKALKVDEQTLDHSALQETAMRQLESELCSTREDLQSHIEQLESLSEELQSSNEELQASNEELETSQEELQSLNEELLTVNAQLQSKIEEQEETNNDLINFLASTNIPTLFLDRQLRVRRFTPAMTKIITLLPTDVGRPIRDLSQNNLGPQLIFDAASVLETSAPVKREIGIDGSWYERSALPYMTGDDRIEGVVIAYSDLTGRRHAELELQRLAEQRQLALDAAHMGWWHYDPVSRMASWDDRYKDIFGVTGYQRPNDEILARIHPDDLPGVWARVEAALDPINPQPYWAEFRINLPDGSMKWIEAHGIAIFEGTRKDRRATSFVGTVADISGRKHAEHVLRESETRYRELVQNANSAIIRWKADGTISFFNEYAESFFGYKSDEVVGRHIGILLPDKESTGGDLTGLVRDIVAHPDNHIHNVNENICSNGRRVWMAWTNKPILGPDGSVEQILAVGTDITGLKHAELEREFTAEFLHLINQSRNRDELIRSAVTFFKDRTGCEAVGIRLKDGDDYPYYETRGFPAAFVKSENSLCARNERGEIMRDPTGNPVLDCMCGNIISGRFDPSKPFFTEAGSFWTNCTTELLASTTEADRQARTRNRCNGEGYESVALIGLVAGTDRLGLLQLNDRRKNVFSHADIALWERLAGYLAVAVSKFQTEKLLRTSEGMYRSLFDNMLNGFAYCRMIFDGDDPTDFIYLAVNDSFAKLTGLQNVVGKRVTEVIPGIRESDPTIFDIYGSVAVSGEPKQFEMYVEALKMWFSISVYSPRKEHFVAVFDVITERKNAERALQESREKIGLILNSTSEGIYGVDVSGNCTFCNPSGIRMLGYLAEEDLIGKNMHSLVHHTRASGISYPSDDCPIRTTLAQGVGIHRDREILWRADGTCFPAEYWTHPIFKDGSLIGTVVSFIDITERVALENQLVQAQKMEAVGQLAGGIAHDFNNLLTAITGHGHLLRAKIAKDTALREDVEQILESADKAAEVTRGLLAFSRQETMNVKPVNINELVGKFVRLLGRIIGEEIEVLTVMAKEQIYCRIDPIRMEQVFMNLATNARDAMPRGGTLTIRTGRTELDETSAARLGSIPAGGYAMISVSDSGEGMSGETLSKIFEPFFTTKEIGKGTGLGLSMVYGIVRQHNGYVDVETAPGMGTTFRIYLPASGRGEEEGKRKDDATHPSRGTGTILIAEDDEKLRRLFGVVLTQGGYQTIFAANGEEAISLFMNNMDKIDLVLMDMIMPKKSGMEAYSEIRKIRPETKVVFLSGYTADRMDDSILRDGGVHLMMKPVSPLDLLNKVGEVLGG